MKKPRYLCIAALTLALLLASTSEDFFNQLNPKSNVPPELELIYQSVLKGYYTIDWTNGYSYVVKFYPGKYDSYLQSYVGTVYILYTANTLCDGCLPSPVRDDQVYFIRKAESAGGTFYYVFFWGFPFVVTVGNNRLIMVEVARENSLPIWTADGFTIPVSLQFNFHEDENDRDS